VDGLAGEVVFGWVRWAALMKILTQQDAASALVEAMQTEPQVWPYDGHPCISSLCENAYLRTD
jgi:hypothetical protein